MSSPKSSFVRPATGSRGAPDYSVRRSRSAAAAPGDGDEHGFLSLTPERAKVLVLVAARPTALTLTAVIVLVLATLLASGSSLAGTSGAIAAGWLAAHQVPLVIGKTSLGLLPLLPTGLLVWLTGRECARAVEPNSGRADLGWILGAALAGPLLVTAVCLAVAEDASGVIALQPPNTLATFGWVGGVHLIAASAGLASRNRRRVFTLLRMPDWAVAGIFGASRTVVRLLACAAAVTVVSFLAHVSRIGDSYQLAGNAAGVIGLTLLSLAYLPNVVVDAVSVLMGASTQFGDASVGVFSVVGGPIPAVPVLVAVPTGPAAGWWPVLLLIPAAVGVLGGLDSARTSTDRITAPWATLSSAGLASVLLALLGAVGGGELGTFGRIGLDLPVFAAASFLWLAIAGYAGLVFGRLFVIPVGTPSPEYHADDDYYPDDEYRDYHDDGYADDDYHDEYATDDYDSDDYDSDDDYFDDEYQHYDGPDLEVEVEGELVDEQPALAERGSAVAGDTIPDIVDAEVVESDLPESDPVDGR
ncbi:DUF6350 family protein [Nocardia sp. KC 131]|uniref:cell division protein PerM n=1 Tax=Nocardia arseniciresistens TaxID=3392119 RepID=UPI00398F597F